MERKFFKIFCACYPAIRTGTAEVRVTHPASGHGVEWQASGAGRHGVEL